MLRLYNLLKAKAFTCVSWCFCGICSTVYSFWNLHAVEPGQKMLQKAGWGNTFQIAEVVTVVSFWKPLRRIKPMSTTQLKSFCLKVPMNFFSNFLGTLLDYQFFFQISNEWQIQVKGSRDVTRRHVLELEIRCHSSPEPARRLFFFFATFSFLMSLEVKETRAFLGARPSSSKTSQSLGSNGKSVISTQKRLYESLVAKGWTASWWFSYS